MYLTRHPAEGPPQRFTQSVTGSVFPPPLPRSKAGNVGYPLSLRLPPIIQPMADSSPKVLPSPSSQSMWLPWQQRSPPFSLPWALSAGGDMLTSLLPEERSSPLTSSSCLPPALSLSPAIPRRGTQRRQGLPTPSPTHHLAQLPMAAVLGPPGPLEEASRPHGPSSSPILSRASDARGLSW